MALRHPFASRNGCFENSLKIGRLDPRNRVWIRSQWMGFQAAGEDLSAAPRVAS
jgi:hypothetical protein